jgi:predicted metal-dependent peptidase
MEEQEIQAMKKELDDLKSILMLETPFLASLLRKCKIILSEDVETVGVDEKAMYINPKFFQPLSRKSKVFIYCHEVLHLAFNHVRRSLGKNHDLFNHASDCCINRILMSHGFKGKVEFPFEINLPENIAKDLSMEKEEIAKMSAEEIYYLLEKKFGQTPFNFNAMKDLLNSPNDKREAKKQIIVQQGDPAANDIHSPEEIEKYWQNAVNRATIQAKMAGTLPAELERLINELSQSKLPWKEIIKKEIIKLAKKYKEEL